MTIKAAAFNQGQFPRIAFINRSNTDLGVDLQKLVAALTKQLQNDFVPIWGYPATLHVTQSPGPDEWQIVFLDDADAARALGYHEVTKDGQPISKVFVRTTLAAGEKVSVTASHELLEMLIDPGIQMWAQNADGLFYAYEMCDAVEEEEYAIDGIAVSNFVYPSFFESWHTPGSVRFDHLGRVSRPFETLRGGYQIVSDGRSQQEVFGSRGKERHFREVEVRTMHRSEYRKELGVGASRGAVTAIAPQSAEAPADADAAPPGRADVLQHLGQLLISVAQLNGYSNGGGNGSDHPGALVPPPPTVRSRGGLALAAARPAAPGSTGTTPSGARYVVYDGALYAGGDRNWRNHNPGNLEQGSFARQHGAIGSDGRFAIFPDLATGLHALRSLLVGRYGSSSIAKMMESYAPPSENNTENYIAFIEHRSGLGRNDVVGTLADGQLDALAQAINAMEGGRAGTVYLADAVGNPAWVAALIGAPVAPGGARSVARNGAGMMTADGTPRVAYSDADDDDEGDGGANDADSPEPGPPSRPRGAGRIAARARN